MRILFLTLLLSSAFGAMVLAAIDLPAAKTALSPASLPAAKPINSVCAVDPENEVDPKITVVYEGKSIGFCCNDCVAEFKKDPTKFADKVK